MSLIHAIILGAIQGLTEFLPVSSTGHLVIAGRLLKVTDNNLAFAAMIHLGTLLAVIIVFRKKVADLLKVLCFGRVKWHRGKLRFPNENTRLLWMLIAASIPAAVAGFLLEDTIERLFLEPYWVGVFMVVTGVFLFITGMVPRGENRVGWGSSLLVGLAQAAAILPGLSRSGTTISAGIISGVERSAAAEFSFLLSIPVILGAGGIKLLKALEAGFEEGQGTCLAAGVATAALVGWLAIKALLAVVSREKLMYFAYYCWLAGIAVIIFL